MRTTTTDKPHAGRVALVTGAARGIGQAIDVGLAERGTTVVIGDIDDPSAIEAVRGLVTTSTSTLATRHEREPKRTDAHVEGAPAAHARTRLGPRHQPRLGNGRDRTRAGDRNRASSRQTLSA
jgi:NAD(P)-dependent dehydrogenase (short-subunit alcohol dehydrogenase family)